MERQSVRSAKNSTRTPKSRDAVSQASGMIRKSEIVESSAAAKTCPNCTKGEEKYFSVAIQANSIEKLLNEIEKLKANQEKMQYENKQLDIQNKWLKTTNADLENKLKSALKDKNSEKSKAAKWDPFTESRNIEVMRKSSGISPFVIQIEENKESSECTPKSRSAKIDSTPKNSHLLYRFGNENMQTTEKSKSRSKKEQSPSDQIKEDKSSLRGTIRNTTPLKTEDTTFANIDVMMYKDVESLKHSTMPDDKEKHLINKFKANNQAKESRKSTKRQIKAPLKSLSRNLNTKERDTNKTWGMTSINTSNGQTNTNYDIKNVLQNYDFVRSMILMKHKQNNSRHPDLQLIPRANLTPLQTSKTTPTLAKSAYFCQDKPARLANTNTFLDISCRDWSNIHATAQVDY